MVEVAGQIEKEGLPESTIISGFIYTFELTSRLRSPESLIIINNLAQLLMALSATNPKLFNLNPKFETSKLPNVKVFEINFPENDSNILKIEGLKKENTYLVRIKTTDELFPGTHIRFITIGRAEGIVGSPVNNVRGKKMDAQQTERFNELLLQLTEKVVAKN